MAEVFFVVAEKGGIIAKTAGGEEGAWLFAHTNELLGLGQTADIDIFLRRDLQKLREQMMQMTFIYAQVPTHIVDGDLFTVVLVDVLERLFQGGMDG